MKQTCTNFSKKNIFVHKGTKKTEHTQKKYPKSTIKYSFLTCFSYKFLLISNSIYQITSYTLIYIHIPPAFIQAVCV